MNCKNPAILFLILTILLSGCVSQQKEIQETETPTPEETSIETPEPKEEEQEEITVEVPETLTTKEYNQIMSDLEKNFPELASELKELPEIKDGISKSDLEALNDIYFLWKNATNPEVKEAFDLMIKGENPNRSYNEQLEKMKDVAKNIKIDGKKEDWKDIEPVISDVKGDDIEKVKGTDLKSVYIAFDNNYLYLLIEMYEKTNKKSDINYYVNIFTEQSFEQPNFRTNGAAWTSTGPLDGSSRQHRDLQDFEFKIVDVLEIKISREDIGNPEGFSIQAGVYLVKTQSHTDTTKKVSINRSESSNIYNNELQILYWLAQYTEFKSDDTLALSIAMSNGIYVGMGNNEVKRKVKRDTLSLLEYFRETNEIQKERGFFQLENYPLEAKIMLSWTGSYSTTRGRMHTLSSYSVGTFDIRGYEWNNVSVETLKKMRDFVEDKRLIKNDINTTVKNLEDHFWFGTSRWLYTNPEAQQGAPGEYILVDGEYCLNYDMRNVDFEFNYILENGHGIGDCGDQSSLIDSLLKSWGIASGIMAHQKWIDDKLESHFYSFYYEPQSQTWRAYEKQLNIRIEYEESFYIYIFKPPVDQNDFLITTTIDGKHWKGKSVYYLFHTIKQIKRMFTRGISTTQMKQWLFYS